MTRTVEDDIATIAKIGAVPTILEVIAETTGMGLTLIARVTPQSWTACAVRDQIAFGMRVGDELEVATTLCSKVRDTLEPIIIEHASLEPAFCEHPTPKLYNFESYIAVPIFRKTGEYFGNVCALDRKPVSTLRAPKTVAMMRLFAELISLQLQAEEKHAGNALELREQKAAAEVREQFLAVLGHDLRNPLSSIVVGTEVLLNAGLAGAPRRTLERVRQSARRIELLADDLLDLTRARLGGGLPLELAEVTDLDVSLRHVVDELKAQHPERTVRFEVDGSGSVVCDRRRVEQVLSNLLGNALQHSPADAPIDAKLCRTNDELVLTVHNRGTPIAEQVLPQLFTPFYRATPGHGQSTRNGLGLGLYIVAEIAKAHAGIATASSSEADGTRFTVRWPSHPRQPTSRGTTS
jgi:sigma-B regulation protein RsbU (phosphoserine phosphatase)